MNEKIKQLVALLKKSDHIVFLGGAGVSTESGIPDFRSEAGIFKTIQEFGLRPEELLSLPFFHQHPDVFYDYYKKSLIYPDAQPNAAHRALARLEADGRLSGIVTQNIDELHQRAGSKKVFELHGSVYHNHCLECGKYFPLSYVMDAPGVPHCDRCGGLIKPDVVLYGEGLDQLTLRGAISRISGADMLIVGGTSLTVYPAAGLVNYFNGSRLVIINKSETQYDSSAYLVIADSIGKVLSEAVDAVLGPERPA